LTPVLDRYRTLVEHDQLADASDAVRDRGGAGARTLLDLFAAARARRPSDPEEERRAAVGTLHGLEALTADDGDPPPLSTLTLPILLQHATETWDPAPASVDPLVAEAIARFYADR
jgi:hypothetical protein